MATKQEILKNENFFEKSSDLPVKTFVPHQAITLKELVSRFERGQRLNVHQNFKPFENMTDGHIVEESFEEAAPDDIYDVVDVHEYVQEHEQRKSAFNKRQKEKKQSESKQAQEIKTPAPQDDTIKQPKSEGE